MEHLSQHAATRMQQRGIPQSALECLLEYGRLQYDHRGGAIVFLDKAARRRLASDLKNNSLTRSSGKTKDNSLPRSNRKTNENNSLPRSSGGGLGLMFPRL